ncbi:MAG: IPT/TIG domain-containing protein [Edaphobacter sp.]
MSAEPARPLRVLLIFALGWMATATTVLAGGPRWITGPPYFNGSGNPVVWYTNQPLYFTDPGDLSVYVNHAAADAIVAAAAGVWNVPTSSLVLAYGGTLDEHISGANAYPGPNGFVFPSDVQSSNYQAKQIAVLYDTDGSITDLLLGNGASDPSSCRQNAVTESIDSIVPAGYIQHALLVLNGRCTGPAPEQQLQMQYQLMRAFGRILGLGWSQVNDNVFTGSPAPTYNQALNWPIMHPIDIICGSYTYQCLPQPFTLRPDDLSALGMLYYIARNTAPPGKIDTEYRAHEIQGTLLFPTGEGMQGVNVVARRFHQYWNVPEAWQSVSSVSGFRFKGSNGNPVTGAPTSMAGSSGSSYLPYEGYYDIFRVPMLDGNWENVVLDTESINPLYTGQYAVGPYIANQVEPSGSDAQQIAEVLGSYYSFYKNLAPNNAADSCNTASDGTAAAPAALASQGWWTGTLCAYGHAAWSTFNVKANRTFTIEVTAQDERGFATTAKAMPVVGVWNATDAPGSLPSVAAAPGAFNGAVSGMTTLTVGSTQPNQLRIAIADQRGDGRPDFAYQSRVLYADSVSPATITAAGGEITVSGMGFRPGNAVTIDGVAATVSNWTATSIVATVPSSRELGFNVAFTVDVAVTDLSTGGTTVMTGALNYAAPVPALDLVTTPSGSIFIGDTATAPFAVKMLSSDGVTPIANQSVTFTSAGGAVRFNVCGASTCAVMTDASGFASTTVTPLIAGSIILSAASSYGIRTSSFTALARVRTVVPVLPVQYIAADAIVLWTPQVNVVDNSAPTAGVLVDWQPVSGAMLVSPAQSQVNAYGIAQTMATAGPLSAGTQATGSACGWTTTCAIVAAQGVGAADWRLEIVSGAGQSVSPADSFATVTLRVTDTTAHPVAGVVVQIHQTVDAWQMPCPDHGRCPVPPEYGSAVSTAISDTNGVITITPLQVPGMEEVTNIVAATGNAGFMSLSLEKQP